MYGISGGGNVMELTPASARSDPAVLNSQLVPDVGELQPSLVAVAASGPGDVWVAEELTTTPGVQPSVAGEAYLAHWDGRSWHEVVVPAESASSDAVPDQDSLVLSDHDVYLLGEGSGMGLLRWNGARWSPVTPPNGYHPTSYGVGDGSGGLWLAGTVGHDPSYLHLTAGGSWSHAAMPGDPRATGDRSRANPVITTFSRAPGSTRLWAGGSTGYFEDLPCDTCGDTRTVDHYRPVVQEYAPTG